MSHDMKWVVGGLGTTIIILAGWLFTLTEHVASIDATKGDLERRLFNLENVWRQEMLQDRQELKERMLQE